MDVNNYYFEAENKRIIPYNSVRYVQDKDDVNFNLCIKGMEDVWVNVYLYNKDSKNNKLNHYLNWVNKSLEIKEKPSIF